MVEWDMDGKDQKEVGGDLMASGEVVETEGLTSVSLWSGDIEQLKGLLVNATSPGLIALRNRLPVDGTAVVAWHETGEMEQSEMVRVEGSILPPDEKGTGANELALCWRVFSMVSEEEEGGKKFIRLDSLLSKIQNLSGFGPEEVTSWYREMGNGLRNPGIVVSGDTSGIIGFLYDNMRYRNYLPGDTDGRVTDEEYMERIKTVAELPADAFVHELRLSVAETSQVNP